jgi:hypothetical protein
MSKNSNHVLGLISMIAGISIIIIAVGDLLLRVVISLLALSLINYGLRLRGLPPLQALIPLIISKKRWF